MANLGEDYNRILSEIEQAISNEQEREIVKQKVLELSNIFINTMDKMSDIVDNKMKEMEERQSKLDTKVEKIQTVLNEIENDIYDEEETGEFDFEIVCPYCSHEFITDINMLSNEVKCPECNNIIELDWNDDEDEGCSGHCCDCHNCDEEENDEDDDM